MRIVRRYTAGEVLSDGDVVYISGSQSVSKATSSVRSKQIGVADHDALASEPVNVVVYGPKQAVADGAINAGDLVTAAATAGRVVSGPGFALGKAEESAAGPGSKLSVFVCLGESREITANDASPGLAVRQQGSAPGLRSRVPSGQRLLELVRESDGVVVGYLRENADGLEIVPGVELDLRLAPGPGASRYIRTLGHVVMGGNSLIMQGGVIDECIILYGKAGGVGLKLSPQAEAADAPVVIQSRNGANNAFLERLKVHSYTDVARIEVLNAAVNIPAATHANPAEGDLRWNAALHKLQLYSGAAWETVSSA